MFFLYLINKAQPNQTYGEWRYSSILLDLGNSGSDQLHDLAALSLET
jgi:hypothetical protein